MSETLNHTPANAKDMDVIVAEREEALRSALSDRQKIATFTVESGLCATSKPFDTLEPNGVDSNSSNGAPISIAYDLPLAQTVDFYVETSNYTISDILSSLEGIGHFSNSIATPEITLASEHKDDVQPANDTLTTTTYAKFEKDNLSNVMADAEFSVSTHADTDGKRHYLFENKNQSTYVVLFKVNDAYMLKVNNLLMPLDRFLTLKQCVAVPLEKKKVEDLELRQDPTNRCMATSCTFEDDSVVQIDNVSVDLVMAIVTHLTTALAVTPATATAVPLPPSPPATPSPTLLATPLPTPPITPIPEPVAEDLDSEHLGCWNTFFSICCPRRR